MSLKKEIGGEIKLENEKVTKKDKVKYKKKKEINIESKDNLIVIEEGKIYTYYGDDMKSHIESIPEDYNVYYVLENDKTVVINKDYKKIAPMVKYLLGNVYESLELRYMRRLMYIFLGIWFFSMFYITMIKVYSPSMEDEILFIKDNITCEIPKENLGVESEIVEEENSIPDISIDDIIINGNKGSGGY